MADATRRQMNAAEHAAAVLSFEIKRRTGDDTLANAVFELLAPTNVIGKAAGDSKKFRTVSETFGRRWPDINNLIK
jgi:hypothetical protein